LWKFLPHSNEVLGLNLGQGTCCSDWGSLLCHNPEDQDPDLNLHFCGNLKPHIFYTKFQDPTLSGASIAVTSEVHVTILLILW